MDVKQLNRYRITKRGKRAIVLMLFLIIFLFVTVIFRLNVNAAKVIKRITLNSKIDTQSIFLPNEKDEKQNIIANVSEVSVITSKIIDSTKQDNSIVDSKITSDKNLGSLNEVKSEVSVNASELSYPVEKAYEKDGKKIAFLTFDDGPSAHNTLKILDVLRNYKIKATFFIVGSAAEKNKDILKAVVNDGHAIGNHTYSHEYKTIYSTIPNFVNEVKKTDSILKDILGSDFSTRIVRFPGGAFQSTAMIPFISELNKEGYVNIDWNSINGDGEGTNIPADKLVKKLKDTVLNQSHLVILMHDSSTKQSTVEALPHIIEYLKAQGYEFATLR